MRKIIQDVARLARAGGDSRQAKARSKARAALALVVNEVRHAALTDPLPTVATVTVSEAEMERWTMALAQHRALVGIKRAQDQAMVALARKVG